MINQTTWDITKQVSESQFVVTLPRWSQLGFSWTLSRELSSAKESNYQITSHTLKHLDKITTVAEWIDDMVGMLKRDHCILPFLINNNFDKEKALAELISHTEKEGESTTGFEGMLLKQSINKQHGYITDRIANNLSIIPSKKEYYQLAEKHVTEFISESPDEYRIDDAGNIYFNCWRLQRTVPVIIPDNIYLHFDTEPHLAIAVE